MIKSVKKFRHFDLDGTGPAVLISYANFEKVDQTTCGYDDINDKVQKFIEEKEYASFDRIYIIDISVNEEVAEMIENCAELKEKMCLLDHHPTALYLNKYNWATVNIDLDEERKDCGTRLFHEQLKKDSEDYAKIASNLDHFVEEIRRYDTWEWSTKYDDQLAYDLNQLLNILGWKKFASKFGKTFLTENTTILDETDQLLLDLEKNKADTYIKKKKKEAILMEVGKYTTVLVFADRYMSELGNLLAKEYEEEADYVTLISMPNILSFRTIKEDVNLGKDIAAPLGGGGHPKAAGAQLSLFNDNKEKYLKELYDKIISYNL